MIFLSRASVLYDKPTNQFHIPTIEEKHQILMKMSAKYAYTQFQGRYREKFQNEVFFIGKL